VLHKGRVSDAIKCLGKINGEQAVRHIHYMGEDLLVSGAGPLTSFYLLNKKLRCVGFTIVGSML